MIITEDFKKVEDLIKQGKNLFITGKAGSGKTTLLKKVQNDYMKNSVVVAPTGVAAINAGGVTIHSMFSLPIGFLDPSEPFEWKLQGLKKTVLKNADILIIDEISMVRCDLMDAIDRRLRAARRCRTKPFGGVQVLMFGDMHQLPPVVSNGEQDVMYEFYDDVYFFNAKVFNECTFQTVVLSEVFRQTDEKFKYLLNKIRRGVVDDTMNDSLSLMVNNTDILNDTSAIHLCALRNVAESYNNSKLGNPEYVFNAKLSGDFNPKSANCDLALKLKVGARVMITKNDNENHQYINGTLGYVTKISENAIMVKKDDGYIVSIEPNTWESFKYDITEELDENDVLVTKINKVATGQCTQFPLTLAYAITIHKSQGLTFDKVVLHIKEIFQSGQLYTALSRCRKMENVYIDTMITKDMVYRNNAIYNFAKVLVDNDMVYGTEPVKTKSKKKSK